MPSEGEMPVASDGAEPAGPKPGAQPAGGLEGFIRRHLKTLTLLLTLAAIAALVWSGIEAARQYVACSTISDLLTKGRIDACTACSAMEQAGIFKSTVATYP